MLHKFSDVRYKRLSALSIEAILVRF